MERSNRRYCAFGSDRATFKRGEARVLLSVGKGYLREDYLLTYTSANLKWKN